MLSTQHLHTRREFLQTGLKSVGLLAVGGYVPAFLTRTALGTPAEKDSPLLVVIQLSGGNDGLNTVVPFGNDLYHKARPTLGLGRDSVLAIDDSYGLHPSLKGFKRLLDDGRAAIVHGVGYPNPDRSHFRSMEYWHTGTAPGEDHQVTGWLGRYFDAQCAGVQPGNKDGAGHGAIGLSFGKVVPQAFRNLSNVGIALDNPDTFQWNPSGETSGLAGAQSRIFQQINRPDDGGKMRIFSAPPSNIPGGISGTDPATLDFLRHTAMNATLTGDTIRSLLGREKDAKTYPDSRLASELSQVARLVKGDFPTRVYYVAQGGYDTHAAQSETHARLLADLGDSVATFLDDLKSAKCSQRVMVLAFSEFGRRVEENASTGTDHGAAAPVFLFGDAVNPGLHGSHPDLANLHDGDLRHTTDFRTVYASLLDQWLRRRRGQTQIINFQAF